MNNFNTPHKLDCNMAFGRKDETCDRCQELLMGAPARAGWQKSYYENKKRNEQMQLHAIRTHDCKKSNCGYMCTFGEW